MRARMEALVDWNAECCWREAWKGMEIVEGGNFEVDLPG